MLRSPQTTPLPWCKETSAMWVIIATTGSDAAKTKTDMNSNLRNNTRVIPLKTTFQEYYCGNWNVGILLALPMMSGSEQKIFVYCSSYGS